MYISKRCHLPETGGLGPELIRALAAINPNTAKLDTIVVIRVVLVKLSAILTDLFLQDLNYSGLSRQRKSPIKHYPKPKRLMLLIIFGNGSWYF